MSEKQVRINKLMNLGYQLSSYDNTQHDSDGETTHVIFTIERNYEMLNFINGLIEDEGGTSFLSNSKVNGG